MLVVSNNSSLADLLRAMVSLEDVQQFYVVDSEGTLKGIITYHQLIEYLSMHYFLTDRSQSESLLRSLESVRVDYLMERNFPPLYLDQRIPAVLENLLISGRNALPVVNSEEILVGEVCIDALLRVLPVKQKESMHAIS
jgi:CBS domain-containing protein